MIKIRSVLTRLLLVLPLLTTNAFGETEAFSEQSSTNEVGAGNGINPLTFKDASREVGWELVGMLGAITYLGFDSWDWGSSKGFQVNHEGWFGMDTGSGGADKVGHLYTTYAISEGFTHALNNRTQNMEDSALWGSVFGLGLMAYVEWFDGYSGDHGFSSHDFLMNTTGALYSYLQNTQPWLKGKMDLRVEYLPSDGMQGFHPMTDYSGYKYLAAIKANGFSSLKNTWAKYFEFHIGYYTRGFKRTDAPYFDNRETTLYTGIGLNLSELFFKKAPKDKYNILKTTDSILKYYQLPGTYYEQPTRERTGPRRL